MNYHQRLRNGDLHLPNELIEHIFSLLTIKDLLRSQCVCNKWETIIKSDEFKNKLYEAEKLKASSLLVWRNSNLEPTLHHCYPHSVQASFQFPLNPGQFIDDSVFDDYSSEIRVSSRNNCISNLCFTKFGAVNGLVYLGWKSFHVIWNPATKQFNRFNAPPKNWEFDLLNKSGICEDVLLKDDICAFGYDPISQDYKFLMAYFACEMKAKSRNVVRNKLLCQLYSVRNNCWKEFIVDFPYVSDIVTGNGYREDGKFYWFANKSGNTYNSGPPAVIVFDFHFEVFEKLAVPEELAHGDNAVAVANRGCLEIVMTFGIGGGGDVNLRGEVWVMEENGSWRNKLTFKLPSNLGRPVGLLKEGEMIFESSSYIYGLKELVLFDPATGLHRNLEFNGTGGTKYWIFEYVQSLFSVKI